MSATASPSTQDQPLDTSQLPDRATLPASGLLPQSADSGAFEAATRLIADAALRRDAQALREMAASLRAVVAAWSEEDPETALAGRAVQLLSSATAALQRIPAPEAAAEVGADSRAHEFLSLVAASGELSSQELIAAAVVDRAQISRVGTRLSSWGLVVRTKAGKEVWWEITDRGREVLAQADVRAGRPARDRRRRMFSVSEATELLLQARRHERRSELMTAALVAEQGASAIIERLLLWKALRRFTSVMPECVLPDPTASLDDRREHLWSTLRHVASDREIQSFTGSFWPVPPPLYDAYAIVRGEDGQRGVVLIDARTSPSEFLEPPVRVTSRSKQQSIKRAVTDTRRYLGITNGRAWSTYVDPAQRLAFLFGLQEHLSAPVWLLNLYFVAAPRGSRLLEDTPASIDEWWSYIERVRHGLGLAEGNPLEDSISTDFVLEPTDVTNATHALTLESAADAGVGLIARWHVLPTGDGSWQVTSHPSAPRPADIAPSKAAAIERAREMLLTIGGGELLVHRRDGSIHDTDMITAHG